MCLVADHTSDVGFARMQMLREHQKWVLGRDFAGRIYISAQGINAQYSAPTPDALAYAEWVAQQPGFKVPLSLTIVQINVACSFWPGGGICAACSRRGNGCVVDLQGLQWTAEGVDGHQFPKLRLKVRPALVQLAGGTRHLPITDPQVCSSGQLSGRSARNKLSMRCSTSRYSMWAQARATPLSPSAWQTMLRNAVAPAGLPERMSAGQEAAASGSAERESLEEAADGDSAAAGSSGSSPGVVVLDVRNAYEWDAGHFVGADRPLEVWRQLWLLGIPLIGTEACDLALHDSHGRSSCKSRPPGLACAGQLQRDAHGCLRQRGPAGAAAGRAARHARAHVLHRRHPMRHLLRLPAQPGVLPVTCGLCLPVFPFL